MNDLEKAWRFMAFVKACNERVSNVSDGSIVRAFLSHLQDLSDVSIEQVAQEASISAPSVSRLVRRLGFSSMREFRQVLGEGRMFVRMNHAMQWRQRFSSDDTSMLVRRVHEEALAHMEATMKSLDVEKLDLIVRQLRASRSVAILGDSLELNMFYVLQVMLMNDGVPAYAFLDQDVRRASAMSLGEGDTILFTNATKAWLTPAQRRLVADAHARGCTVIVLSQEDLSDLIPIDIAYLYGVPGTGDTAYYSILPLSDMLRSLYERDLLASGSDLSF